MVERPWAGGTALTHAGSNNQWDAVMWMAPHRRFTAIAVTNCGGAPAGDALEAVIRHRVEPLTD